MSDCAWTKDNMVRYTLSIYLDILPKKLKAGGMAWQLRAPIVLEDRVQFPTPTCGGSQL